MSESMASTVKNEFKSMFRLTGVLLAATLLASCGGGGGGGVEMAGDDINDAPVAVNDATSVAEGQSVNIDLAGNDSDADNGLDLASITIVSAPGNGVVTVNNDGTVDYQHDGSETTADSFTYTIKDASGATSNAATVNLTVTPVNDVPVANNDTAGVGEGQSVVIDLAANDSDADDGLDLTSIAIVSVPANGGVTLNGDGTVNYLHNGSETVSDSFTYTIDDNSGATSNTATVTLTIVPANDVPVAVDDAASVAEGQSVNINLAGNDSDADNGLDLTSLAIVSAPGNGVVTVNNDGTVDYQHDGSETAADSFTYTIKDTGGVSSNVATVSITVTPVNDAPVAVDDAATVNEGASINIGLVTNDTDSDDGLDPASIVIVNGPVNGTIVNINANGSVDYTHDGSETTADSFTYTIDDAGGVTSNIATVTITVTPVNDAPVATDDSATVNQNDSVIIDLAANDGDADDGLDRTSIVPGAATSGTVVSNGDGTVTYTNTAAATSDSFTYTINDISGASSNIATVSLTVLQGFNEALYATPSVSSASDSGGANVRQFQANDGITGNDSNGWVAAGGDLAPSITLTFDAPKAIYRVTLSDLVDLTNNVTSATIDFSNGDQILVSNPLPNNGTAESFVFPTKTVTWIKVTLNTATGAFGLSEVSAFSALDPGQTTLKTDLFNDGDVTDWPVTITDCDKGTANWTLVNNQFAQTGNCRGFSDEGVELGSYPVLDAFTVKDMDLRLRFKSTDVSASGATWVNGAIGMLFAYRPNDYYRLDLSRMEGHTKVWKKVGDGLGGANFTELTTSPQSYTPDAWVNLRVVRQNGVILVYLNSVKTLAVADNEPALNSNPFQITLLCARNESCTFDNLIVLSPPSLPIVGANIDDDTVHTSGEYFVDTSGSIDVQAEVTDASSITGVEFIVDEGQAGVLSVTDNVAPYNAVFGMLAEGEHTVRTYLLDADGRLSGARAVDELPQVGIRGIHLVGLGDSIAGGLFDDDASDDISPDGRNTSGGYQPVLNGLLTSANTTPVTVLNEGNPDETSAEGLLRLPAVLARTPAAQAYLTLYGANDSGASVATPSGLGLASGAPGYAGSFKDNMQQLINAAAAAGKAVILGKTPPHIPIGGTRDLLIQEYNAVIDELVTENGFGYTAPDFHAYFEANPAQMVDALHPNGAGYKAMADGWCKHMNGVSLPNKGMITCTEAGAFPF